MQMEELQNNSSYLTEKQDPDFRNNHLSRSSPLQECGGYIPSVFRGINTSGSYHVYGDLRVAAGTLEGPKKLAFFRGPAAPVEGEDIPHPQTGCLRLSPSCSKGVICSPQSPLRSDCQPNSPTESSSSINASLGLKQSSDCPRYAKARNWKKYKFIVMNQTSEQEAQRSGAESPSRSPSRCDAAGRRSESQVEEDASSHREDMPSPQSELSCSNR